MLLKLSTSGGLAAVRRHLIGGLLRFSSAAVGGDPSPNPNFMADYLVASCGFSPDKASTVSKRLSHLTSPENPDAVLGFLRSQGFSETQVRKLIAWNPRWLAFNVEKTISPKFRALQDLGISGSDLTHVVVSKSSLLTHSFHSTLQPFIELWRDLGSDEHLTTLLKRFRCFYCGSIRRFIHNVSLLRECGVKDKRIAVVARNNPSFLLRGTKSFRALMEQVVSLGIPHHSGMFLWALSALCGISKANFNARRELMKSLGWSEQEFVFAFRRKPYFVRASVEVLREKMDFLVNEAGCQPLEVSHYPDLLMYSLKKRLVPRHGVLQLLKARGLLDGKCKLTSYIRYSERNFIKNPILRFIEQVPELKDMYITAVQQELWPPILDVESERLIRKEKQKAFSPRLLIGSKDDS